MERERLGSGANGVVREGRDIQCDKCVAVKMIEKKSSSLTFTKDVSYEGSLMRRLNHPRVVKVYDVY